MLALTLGTNKMCHRLSATHFFYPLTNLVFDDTDVLWKTKYVIWTRPLSAKYPCPCNGAYEEYTEVCL